MSEWKGDRCQRCYNVGHWYIMSMFNEQMICKACKSLEEKRPDYKRAVEADVAAIRAGNFNFRGIEG